MSDSLNATVIVIVWELTISANGVLVAPDDVEDEVPEAPVELELPKPPALVAVDGVLDEPVDDDPEPVALEAAVLEVDPAVTASPLVRPASETIVPLVGA
jgi:hypothetical protein